MPIRLDDPDSVVKAIRATRTAAQQHAKLTPPTYVPNGQPPETIIKPVPIGPFLVCG